MYHIKSNVVGGLCIGFVAAIVKTIPGAFGAAAWLAGNGVEKIVELMYVCFCIFQIAKIFFVYKNIYQGI